MFKKLSLWLVLMCAFVAGTSAQQPQAPTAPISPLNAKYVDGVGVGYAPSAGTGLTLNVAKGTANCGGTIVTYAGGTLTMTASTTNYIYLNTASSCVPAVKTTTFTSSDIPLAVIVTGSSAITTITDDRTMMQEPGSGGGGGGGSGTVNTGTSGQIAVYPANGSAVSGTNALPSGTTATTQSSSDNSTNVATTAFVQSVVTGGGAPSGIPFTVVQEAFQDFGNGTSDSLTFPLTAASSGNTLFALIATDSITITTPSGWTQDWDKSTSGAQIALYHKTSASDTSVTFPLSSTASAAVYFMELGGSRSLDVVSSGSCSVAGSGVSYDWISFPSITPSSGAWPFLAFGYQSGTTTVQNAIVGDGGQWKPIGYTNFLAGSYRSLGLAAYTQAASGSALAPRTLPLLPSAINTGLQICAAFSIK